MLLRDAYPSLIDEGDCGLLQGLLTVCSAYTNHHNSSADSGSKRGVAQVAECYIEYYRRSVPTDATPSTSVYMGKIAVGTESAHPLNFTNNIKVSGLIIFHSHILKCLGPMYIYIYLLIFTLCLRDI